MASRKPAAILEHHFNSRLYPTHWHVHGVNFITSLGVLYRPAVQNGHRRNRAVTASLIWKRRQRVKHGHESRGGLGTNNDCAGEGQ
jgi:hypothetical protein